MKVVLVFFFKQTRIPDKAEIAYSPNEYIGLVHLHRKAGFL